ncbi:hypothetical protein AYK26_01180 [Euryarchaeota archaeon SM23-78]|nr:MAG: hypothetical protein AYK26_01180 [Euryarchaeota archaeon SM23-78]MBW3001447.1 hypothetical protein [Candidatus Woesearchaeota archaeon]
MLRLKDMFQKAKRHKGKIITGTILAGALAFGPHLYVTSQDCLRRGKIENNITQLEQTLSDTYHLEIDVWSEPTLVGFGRPSPPLIKKSGLRSHSPYMSLKALEGLEEAMRYYPKELLQKHLQKVEIVRAYTYSTEEIMKQGATPVAYVTFWGGMSISAGRDEWLRYHHAVLGTIFENKSFHHELAHILTQDIPKEEWRALHPDAVYNSSTWKSLPSTPPGFFNNYCTHSIGEDIAGTVELLYSNDYKRRIDSDTVLRKKSEYLKKWYLTISDGVINDTYWSTVQNGKIPKW